MLEIGIGSSERALVGDNDNYDGKNFLRGYLFKRRYIGQVYTDRRD